MLVTSRVRLRLPAEVERPVAPLVGAAAVELFVQRARLSYADLVLDGPTDDVVASICDRLDCLPLAIELAAARVGLFPPAALLAKLQADQRLPLLMVGFAERPARQQTLRATLAWSYELLHPAARKVFAGWVFSLAVATSRRLRSSAASPTTADSGLLRPWPS
jgi:predicted ATPase